MIHIRKLHSDDLPLFAEWMRRRGIPGKTGYLSPDTTWVAELDGTPVLTKTLVTTNVGYGLFDMALADPDSKWQDREELTPMLDQALLEQAEDLGIQVIMTFSNKPRVQARLLRSGFVEIQDGYKMYFREVN